MHLSKPLFIPTQSDYSRNSSLEAEQLSESTIVKKLTQKEKDLDQLAEKLSIEAIEIAIDDQNTTLTNATELNNRDSLVESRQSNKSDLTSTSKQTNNSESNNSCTVTGVTSAQATLTTSLKTQNYNSITGNNNNTSHKTEKDNNTANPDMNCVMMGKKSGKSKGGTMKDKKSTLGTGLRGIIF